MLFILYIRLRFKNKIKLIISNFMCMFIYNILNISDFLQVFL